MSGPRHWIGIALGAEVSPKGSICAVCGPSRFASKRPAAEVFSSGFVDYDLCVSPAADWVCDGCARMLGGKPGDSPPPLKAAHFVVVDGQMLKPSGAELLPYVVDPPGGIQAIAWTGSRKKHASLRCGPCSPLRVEVGTEDGTAAIDVASAKDAAGVIQKIRMYATQDEVLSGNYAPQVALNLGMELYELDARITHLRGGPVLSLLVALVRRPDAPERRETVKLTETQLMAGRIVLTLGNGAPKRDPIEFWKSLVPRRVAVAANRATLWDAMQWLSEKLGTSPYAAAEAIEIVSEVDDMTSAEVLKLMREAPAFVVGVARHLAKEAREGKEANPNSVPLEAA